MSFKVTDTDLGWGEIIKSIESLPDKGVKVGYLKSSGGFGVTELAMVHEFGAEITVTDKMRKYLGSQGIHLKKSTKVIKIPPRPFIRSSFDNNADEVGDTGRDLLVQILEGKVDIDMAYEIWGESFKSIIQNGVADKTLGLAANSKVTAERKGSDTPLVDTGRLINAIEVEVG